MTTPCLETKNIWYRYPDGPAALRGLSLTIAAGEFVALVGQNGSGKTTLAKHFNGLLRPTEGQVFLNGADIGGKPVSQLARSVGYVFQNPDHQIFNASTRQELAAGPGHLGLSKPEIDRRVDEVLDLFRLSAYADRQPALLSFGLRRKISIAAVYTLQTPVLILDEPTSGLDHKSITELMQLLLQLHRQGRTIILITHDMRVVAEVAPRCLVLHEGRCLAFDDTRTVFSQVDLLRQTHLEVPQITQLSRRMAPHGLPDTLLTVNEFCQEYNRLNP